MFVAAEYSEDKKGGCSKLAEKPGRARLCEVDPTLELLDSQQEARYEDVLPSIPGVYEAGVMRGGRLSGPRISA